MARKNMISKTGTKGSKAHFVTRGTPKVQVGPSGGVNIGTPTHCTAKRAAGNVKQGY